jgi:hypothetical protein
MEDIVKLFVDKLSALGPVLTFFFMLAVTIIVAYKKQIGDLFHGVKVTKLFSKPVEEATYEDLNAHDLFNVIEDVRATTKFYEFTNDVNKTKIFHDFIGLMLDEIRRNFKSLIQEVNQLNRNKKEVTRDELKQVIMKTLVIIVENYCDKAERHLIDKGLSKVDAEYVVDLFEQWRSETRASINSRINAIFASSFHQTNFSRTLAVFELISVSVSLIPKDGIRSFESMNGKFKTITY